MKNIASPVPEWGKNWAVLLFFFPSLKFREQSDLGQGFEGLFEIKKT